MAFDVLDEHEQGELVQKWLRENALAIIAGIVLGLVLIFGWQKWLAHRAQNEANAAARYQALVEAAAGGKNDDVKTIAASLRKEFPGSTYAVLAALQQAEEAAAKNDLGAAAGELEWAGNAAGDAALRSLVAVRSARVKLAQGDAESAMKEIDGLPKDAYPALVGELRGDALAKLGRTDAARTAYTDALAHLEPQAPSRDLVQMKLDDLPASALPPAANPSASKDASIATGKGP